MHTTAADVDPGRSSGMSICKSASSRVTPSLDHRAAATVASVRRFVRLKRIVGIAGVKEAGAAAVA
jgi:hypothetical protein